MKPATNTNDGRQAARKSPDPHAAKDPFAKYDHLVEELTEEQQKAIGGGFWLSAGMIAWRGGW